MKIIFLFLFLSLSIYAQTINAQIHALEHASPKERVSLMNSIKKKLVMMNEDERVQTLGVLKARLHRGRGKEHNDTPRRENINSHEEQHNHEMMHQGVRGSHHQSDHDTKGDKKGHTKHSTMHNKAYDSNSRGR